MNIAYQFIIPLALLFPALLGAAEGEDKDLTILRLQKVIAEQTLSQLLEHERVREYERIRGNYQKLLEKIAEKEKTQEKKSE